MPKDRQTPLGSAVVSLQTKGVNKLQASIHSEAIHNRQTKVGSGQELNLHNSEASDNNRYKRNPTHRETAIEVPNSLAPERKARPSDADQVVLDFADLEERKRTKKRLIDHENRIEEAGEEDDESM